jgi:hypothetical protein
MDMGTRSNPVRPSVSVDIAARSQQTALCKIKTIVDFSANFIDPADANEGTAAILSQRRGNQS